jgi:hypothetical protein
MVEHLVFQVLLNSFLLIYEDFTSTAASAKFDNCCDVSDLF